MKKIGADETASKVIAGMKRMMDMKKGKICFVSILPRPSETYEYEKIRRRTNTLIREQILSLRTDDEQRGCELRLMYLDVDRCLNRSCYGNE